MKSEIDNQILIGFYNKRVSRATNEEQVVQLCNELLEKLFSNIGFDSFKHAVSAERSVLRKKVQESFQKETLTIWEIILLLNISVLRKYNSNT